MKQDERKVLGILAIVFGGISLLLSWIPIVNNIAFVSGIVGLILGLIGLFINRKSKKSLAIIGTCLSIAAMCIVLITQAYYSNTLNKVTNSGTEKASNNTEESGKYSFKNDTYSNGKLSFKFTGSEVRDSVEDGKKVLVVKADMTNDTDQEQDAMMVGYAYIKAYQKNDNQNVDLKPGTVKLNDDASNPFQKEEENLHQKLLPHKTVPVVFIYSLENDSNVKLSVSDAMFKEIGSKEYSVK